MEINAVCCAIFPDAVFKWIVETAKANGLDVFEYLSWLFRQITAANHNFTDEFLEKLMPWSELAQENC